MACTDDDGDSDGPEVDDSIRTRTFEPQIIIAVGNIFLSKKEILSN